MNQFEDMQTFIRIVEAGSITKAAEQLDTVKSAVSRRLSELEKRLGVSLVTRTTRSQTLTDHGKSYYQQCLRIIDDVAEIEANVSNDNCALAGRIKIAAPLSFGLNHLSNPLREFNERHPDIYFDIDFNDRKIDLVQDGFDLAIRIARLEDSSLMARRLTGVKLFLSASPEYLKQHGTINTPNDLYKGHKKLQYSTQPESWQFKASTGERTSVKIPSALTSNNGNFLCQSAVDGKGLIYTPDFICYKAIAAGQLVPLLGDYLSESEIPVYAVYPHTRHLSQRVRVLVDYLAQYFGKSPYWQVPNN